MANVQRTRPVSIVALACVYFAGAVAWSVFHLVSYLWATFACSVPERLLIAATTALTSAVTIGAMLYGRRALHSLQSAQHDEAAPDPSSADRFVALCGLYLNAFFLATILLTSLGIFFLRACE